MSRPVRQELHNCGVFILGGYLDQYTMAGSSCKSHQQMEFSGGHTLDGNPFAPPGRGVNPQYIAKTISRSMYSTACLA